VSEITHSSLAKTAGSKNILLHRETILILSAIVLAIVVLTFFFSFMWTYFKVGFMSLLAFLLIVVTRKTDSWKMGIECFYIFSFIFSYVFSPWFAIILVVGALLTVVKLFRPDELQGTISQIVGVIIIAFIAMFFSARYGLVITQQQLLFAGVLSFLVGDLIRFLVALKVTPAHWVKLFASLITGAFINYFYYSTFAFPLLKLLMSFVG